MKEMGGRVGGLVHDTVFGGVRYPARTCRCVALATSLPFCYSVRGAARVIHGFLASSPGSTTTFDNPAVPIRHSIMRERMHSTGLPAVLSEHCGEQARMARRWIGSQDCHQNHYYIQIL